MESSKHDRMTITCYPSSFASIGTVTVEQLSDSLGAVYLLDADGSVPPPSLETRVKVLYNRSSLFVIFEGRFEELRTASTLPVDPATGKSDFLWEHSDVYEAFIGPDARTIRRYKEFQVSPDSRWIDIDIDKAHGHSDHRWVSGFHCRSFIDRSQKMWRSIMAFPWSAFGKDYQSKCEWNANFYRASGKFHGDELLAWSPTGRFPKAFHQPEKFGIIVFEK